MDFEPKTKEMQEIIEDCEKNNYGIVFVESVSSHMANKIMELEMEGYSIEEPDLDEDDEVEGYDPKNFVVTMVRATNGLGMIRVMEVSPELANEVKEYQTLLRERQRTQSKQDPKAEVSK